MQQLLERPHDAATATLSHDVPYAAEIRDVLDENQRIRASRSNLTASQRALGQALDRKLKRYLRNPATINLSEVRNLELAIEAAGRGHAEADGIDAWRGIRLARLDLLQQITRVSREWRKKNTQFPSDMSEPIGLSEAFGPIRGVEVEISPAVSTVALTDAQRIGRNIKLARERKGWTQLRLANLLGVNRTQVNDWEKGRHRPLDRTLHRLADALDVEYAWLIVNGESSQ
jgi:ribosome-binding protein aMBF1 (putative translation factor)